jgi:nicotinate-nucleotide pyrophosphorylase (carboxylating)
MNAIPLPPSEAIAAAVGAALAEDIGPGDLTAHLIPATAQARAQLITRQEAVLCGAAWLDETFRQIDAGVHVSWAARDGEAVHAGQVLCNVDGPARAILAGERTALNFLQTLSGTATSTRRYVDAVRGMKTIILDTRKTVPGLRLAQKYATRCGGAHNHRLGLYDGILIKENHIAAAGSLGNAVRDAKAHAAAPVVIEVEVENLDQLREALAAGAERILLDNFSVDTIRGAVVETHGRAMLEVSGGVSLTNVRALAETGVDYISIGDLTKNISAVDLSLRFI